jgi:hypothetical protein
MGPQRVDRETIGRFFAPELQERYFAREEFEDLPDMVGGGMTQAYYWFRRNLAHRKPAEVLAQIHATLARHGVDAAAQLRAAGDQPLDDGITVAHLAKIVGPGRLGLSHYVPEPHEAAGILAGWCAHAGVRVRDVENLLTLFASERHAKLCTAGAPRCDQCAVVCCKRLRYR